MIPDLQNSTTFFCSSLSLAGRPLRGKSDKPDNFSDSHLLNRMGGPVCTNPIGLSPIQF